jgi:hypothetical protein
MRTVVLTDGRVAVKAEWNSIIDVGTTWIKVCNLDSDANCASTQAAMAPIPEQHTYLVLFLEVVASPGHARSFLLQPNRDREGLTASPLPHHRTYGSRIRRFGGLSQCGAARRRSPSESKNAAGSAILSAGL